MYNLRYHIASLVGVFLALALGLVLGGLVVGQGTMEQQQGALVEGLRKEFTTLRAENQKLSDQNELLKTYSAMMTEGWTADRLAGRTTVIIANSGRSDGLKAATEAIEGANGTVVTVTMSATGLDLSDADLASAVASATGETEPSAEKIAEALRIEWTSGGAPRPLTDALVEAEVLEVNGLTADVAASSIVDLAGPDNAPDEFALAIARAFSAAGLPAVGGQTPVRDTGVAAASAAAGLSALDTLGTDVGRYTVVALLTGASPGYYGEGDGAVAPFPPLPEP